MIARTSVSDSGARRLVELLGEEYELGSQNWQQKRKVDDPTNSWDGSGRVLESRRGAVDLSYATELCEAEFLRSHLRL